MGVKSRFFRGAWWIFIDHHGKRRAKRIGDHQTALSTLRAQERSVVLIFICLPPSGDLTSTIQPDLAGSGAA